ncbi:MAG: glycoside hydrolase family 127 protein [Candidatus Aminicenantes bacterium]|nr:glycoside hydrolase family 127 protein [Candidatus Aminicenantes bacterium]
MKNKNCRLLAYFVLMMVILLALTHCRSQKDETGLEKIKPKISIKARPFPLKNVRLLDGPFKEAMERNRQYLYELDADRLLHNFRVNAGLPSSAESFGGWERPDCELRGHFTGHFLTACALMYSAANDEVLKRKADTIVSELAKCQESLGESGYLSAYPEEFIDRVIEGKRVWAPWYTLHKIYAGLLDMYLLCGNTEALEVVEKMAAWAKMRTDRLDEEQMQRMLRVEFGGMNDVLANLYAVTGNPDHLALARRFDHKIFFEPLADHRDELKGLHVNTQIPKVIGAAREYELTGEKYYYEVASYFWDEVVNARSYCTGGTSNYEGWGSDPNQLAGQLSNATHETCCTYNLLKLTRHLFSWNPDPSYADYYERALFNGILPTLDPETAMTMYYVPMESGWHKTFGLPLDSFWCCTGTGIENHAKYGDSIYFHDRKGIFVNLFIASELDWPEKGVTLRQETRFPEEEGTTLIIQAKKRVRLDLRLRIPYWATGGATVEVNGQAQDVSTAPSSYLTLNRTWADGDTITVKMSMSLHLWRMPDDPTAAAIFYGPLALAGELETAPLSRDKVYGQYHASGTPAPAPVLVTEEDDLNAWIQPVKGSPLTFHTVNAGKPDEVTLIPFYKLFNKRYAIHWRLFNEKEWQDYEARQQARAAEEARKQKMLLELTVDAVRIGDRGSEQEHNLQSERSASGRHRGKSWRHATNGGWFSYELKVLPGQPMTLMCTYWGSGLGRNFDILIDGEKIATQVVNVNFPGDFFDVTYKIPAELTEGKEKVTVKFQAHPGSTAGGVFGCFMLKQDKKS